MSNRFEEIWRIDENGKCRLMTPAEQETRAAEIYERERKAALSNTFIQNTAKLESEPNNNKANK